jgi:formate-dependent phosphoribosylglycinamide formyltransferase (GAR transformylase)
MTDTTQMLDELLVKIEKDIAELDRGVTIFSKPPHQDQKRMDWCIQTAITFKQTREKAVKLREQLAREQANKNGS